MTSKRVDSVLYEIKCGRVHALPISIRPGPDYDADALKAQLLADLRKEWPEKHACEGGKIFNTYYVVTHEAEALTLARKQVIGYREWLLRCNAIIDALSRDLI